MVVHKLLGDLSALNSQAKILAGTLQAGQERKRMHDWLVRYAKREGWGGPVLDVVTACGPNSEWQGAPTSVGTDRVLASTTIAKTADDITYQVCDAQRYTMKMTGIGFAKHPTWAGGSMCIAALVDPAATDEPPFSAIDYDRLSWGQQVASIAIKKATGVPLGKSREQLAIARGSLVANHVLYSGEPQRIDERAREQLRGVFADFAGHVRFQQGVFMAWEWLGKDQAKWGAELADALRVLEGVRTVVHRPPKRKRQAWREVDRAPTRRRGRHRRCRRDCLHHASGRMARPVRDVHLALSRRRQCRKPGQVRAPAVRGRNGSQLFTAPCAKGGRARPGPDEAGGDDRDLIVHQLCARPTTRLRS